MGRIRDAFAALVRRFGTGVVALVAVVAVIIVAVVVAVSTGGGKTYKLTAYFTRTVGLYSGNDVRIMGVKVGHIDSITPEGRVVKVVMSYDANDKVPAGAKAVVIIPSIVSDRYIQLTPGYTSGPTLPNNAVLGCPPTAAPGSACSNQTAVPLELDEIFGNINTLNAALGPNGANKHGALSQLLKISAANLKGNGTAFNKALSEFASAISTLAGSRGDLFGTVTHLQKFTSTLARDDGGVRALNANLAKVGGQLAGERRDLGAALGNLATALSAVQSFVAHNRSSLTGDIHGLAKVTDVLSKEKEAITQFTDIAPVALSDLSLSYDPKAQTLDTKGDISVPLFRTGPAGALCQFLETLGLNAILGDVAGCNGTGHAGTTAGTAAPRTPPTLRDLLAVKP
jgi:phospholipid/cholesterol/gamma-HCH transport system substrate-binding protein